jgi:hypothetical protein
MKRREFIAAGVATLSLRAARSTVAHAAAIPARTQERVKPANRAEATAIVAAARSILTPNGVERLEKVKIGGIDQWVSIRGTDRRNPLLLHIHGGPGYVSIPMSWWFSREWEDYFTVVQWDQRAAGKTFLLTDPAVVAPTLTPERMIDDAEEMAAGPARTSARIRYSSWATVLAVISACNSRSASRNGFMPILASASSSTDQRASGEAGASPWTRRVASLMPRRFTNSRQLHLTVHPAVSSRSRISMFNANGSVITEA